MQVPPPPGNLAQHQRARIRTLERDNKHLEQVRQRLERLLAITLKAAAGQDCSPYALLQVLETLDRLSQKGGRSIEDLAALLRDTDPDKIGKAAA